MPVPGLLLIFWLAGLGGLLSWLLVWAGWLSPGLPAGAFFVSCRLEGLGGGAIGSQWGGRFGLLVVGARQSGSCGVFAYRRKGKAGTWGIRSS